MHTRCALVTGVQTCALPILLPASDLVDIADFETSVGDGVAACIYRQIEGVDFRLAVHLRHAGARDHAILLEISGHILRPAETAEQRCRHAARNARRRAAPDRKSTRLNSSP